MGALLDVVDHDEEIRRLLRPPIIVNELNVEDIHDKDLLERHLLTNYHGNTYSMIPTCDCGMTQGGDKKGKTCPVCQTLVLPHTERPMESELWIQAPEGVHGLINPIAYWVMSLGFNYRKVNVIRWLIDPTYRGQFDVPPIEVLQSRGIRRGLNHFIENFDYIIEILMEKGTYTNVTAKSKREETFAFIQQFRDRIFPSVLPIPNRISFVTERGPTGKYAEARIFGNAIDAVNTITALRTRITPVTQIIKENAAVKACLQLCDFYFAQWKEALGNKKGWFRKHIFGTRMPFTGRSVITSITDIHDYDELHTPWALSVAIFKFHLMNKLLKRGYTINEAFQHIYYSVNNWNRLTRDLFDELLKEASGFTSLTNKPGQMVLFNRNPTLTRGSVQQYVITQVKDDLSDISISLSVNTLISLNADFDGDSLNMILALDDFQSASFARLNAWTGTLDLQSVMKVSGNTHLPKPLISTINHWLTEDNIHQITN